MAASLALSCYDVTLKRCRLVQIDSLGSISETRFVGIGSIASSKKQRLFNRLKEASSSAKSIIDMLYDEMNVSQRQKEETEVECLIVTRDGVKRCPGTNVEEISSFVRRHLSQPQL
jgi:20S proteasome alpha/beta subunit